VIGETRPGLLSVGAIGALFAATGATLALVKAMNRAYEVEEQRSFVRRYATAIALTLLATLGVVVSFVSIVGGTLVTEELAEGAGWGGTAWAIANVARWPAAFLLLTVAVGALLRLAPNVAAPWRLTLAGGALFAVGWLGATFAFAWYATNVGNYGSTYGALAGVIVLMFWFYLSALLLVLVAQLVAMATKQWAPERIEQSRRLDGAAEDVAGAAERLVDGVKDAADVETGEDRGHERAAADPPSPAPREPAAHAVRGGARSD
jgi:membrane protein